MRRFSTSPATSASDQLNNRPSTRVEHALGHFTFGFLRHQQLKPLKFSPQIHQRNQQLRYLRASGIEAELRRTIRLENEDPAGTQTRHRLAVHAFAQGRRHMGKDGYYAGPGSRFDGVIGEIGLDRFNFRSALRGQPSGLFQPDL